MSTRQEVERLLAQMRRTPLDEQRARTLAALIRTQLNSAARQKENGGRGPRTLH